MFSFIHGVLIDPYPMYKDIDRLVQVELLDPTRPRSGGRFDFQLPEFLDYQEQVHSFEEVIAGTFEDQIWTTPEGAERPRRARAESGSQPPIDIGVRKH